ncbi:hypothetical protein DFH11DRAFT_1601060 [Phellopilus nigrolimitatus]|nr:hypothetical protein DFH11DRAFT_1601060 [Phellopilus nigrolimitatus]
MLNTNKVSAKTGLPPIHWSHASHFLTWQLIAELESTENRKILCGKEVGEKSNGERKVAACRRIGEKLLPQLAQTNVAATGDKIKKKIDSLFKTYREHDMLLQQTGQGVGAEGQDSGVDQVSSCYVGKDGPDITTTREARNIWEQITKSFPFFPSLHRLLSTRPNSCPPAVAMGVGPGGRKITYFQPPANYHPNEAADIHDDHLIDPALEPPESLESHFTLPRSILGERSSNVALPEVPPHRHIDLLHTPASANNENQEPPSSQQLPTQSSTPARNSALASAMENAEKTVTQLPQKRSFDDRFVDVHERSMEMVKERMVEESAYKKQKLKQSDRDVVVRERESLIRQQELNERRRSSARRDYDDQIFSKEEYRQTLLQVNNRDEEIIQVLSVLDHRVSETI